MIDSRNQAIEAEKTAIESKNQAIEAAINKMDAIKNTTNKAIALFKAYGNEGVFGRSDIATMTAASYSAAGESIAKLKASDLIAEVKGQGKGKYHFPENQVYNQSKQE